jgi:PAS domain S-box-containing protein
MMSTPSTLRQEEWNQLMTHVLESSSILVTDSHGIIIWVNQTFIDQTGFSLQEAIGKTPRILQSGKHDDHFYSDMWKTISLGKKWQGYIRNQRKDGSLYIGSMMIFPIFAPTGEITHYVSINQDITSIKTTSDSKQSAMLQSIMPLMTELKDVTTALEQSRSEMHAMLNATSEAMMLLSPEDVMLWLNRSFCSFFCINEQDAKGRTFGDLENHWEKVFEGQEAIHFIQSNTHNAMPTPERRTVTQIWPQKRELEIYSARVENKAQGYLGQLLVFRDVTREKEVERMKSEFVSLVSHEFRTPLTSIRGYTEMMLDGDTGELSSEQAEFLRTIHRNSTHLTGIVNDLLEVSKLEAGGIRLKIETVNLIELINNCVQQLRPQLEEKKQKLVVKIPREAVLINLHPNRINQVMLNLISNAHKYTPVAGSVSISVTLHGSYVKVDVKDNGIGISKEEQKKLFSKFYRVENAETIKAGGTGLGLWITKSLVEMHRGEISVTSKSGSGSTFSFTLPMTEVLA